MRLIDWVITGNTTTTLVGMNLGVIVMNNPPDL